MGIFALGGIKVIGTAQKTGTVFGEEASNIKWVYWQSDRDVILKLHLIEP